VGFTGQREVASTGLLHFPARAYDPSLGRFLQPDPFVQDPADPQTLNRYSYVRNNPVNFVDPTGYSFRSWLRAAFAAVAAIVVGIVAPEASPFVFAAIVGTAAAAGDQAGAAIDRRHSSSASPVAPPPVLPSPAPPAVLLTAANQAPGSTGPLLSEEEIAAADLPIEEASVIDMADGMLTLVGMGVAAKGASMLVRQLGRSSLRGLRSLGERGAVRFGREQAETTLKAGRKFSRYMSEAEAEAVGKTGLLRGGRPGKTYFTTNKYQKASSAQSKLSLENPPEVRLDFELKKDLDVTGPRTVGPKYGQPGQGIEFESEGPVEVDILRKRFMR
jgi:RHS repeat-associated protein